MSQVFVAKLLVCLRHETCNRSHMSSHYHKHIGWTVIGWTYLGTLIPAAGHLSAARVKYQKGAAANQMMSTGMSRRRLQTRPRRAASCTRLMASDSQTGGQTVRQELCTPTRGARVRAHPRGYDRR